MKKTLMAIGLVAAFGMSSVQAGIHLNYNGVNGETANITKPDKGAVTAGIFTMSGFDQNGEEFDFRAFCVDIFNTVRSHEYTYVGNTANGNDPFNWDATRMGRVNYLFDNYSILFDSDSDINADFTDQHAAAFQLTLWEILNERPSTLGTVGNDNAGFNLNHGLFQATGDSATIALAEVWINDVWNNAEEGYESELYNISFWDGHSGDPYSQNLISWTNIGGEGDCANDNCEVPEPASLALMSLGLFGLGFIRRRKVNN